MKPNSPSKVGIKTKVARELKEMVVLTAYLYVTFGVIIFYRFAFLRGVGVSAALWGLAIIKALLVAKFILLARAARIGERFQDKPLVWPTLYKSMVFLPVVLILTAIEEAVVALINGRSIIETVGSIGGGTLLQLAATLVLVFCIFVPYFAIGSLGEVLGEHSIGRVFFVERRKFHAEEAVKKGS